WCAPFLDRSTRRAEPICSSYSRSCVCSMSRESGYRECSVTSLHTATGPSKLPPRGTATHTGLRRSKGARVYLPLSGLRQAARRGEGARTTLRDEVSPLPGDYRGPSRGRRLGARAGQTVRATPRNGNQPCSPARGYYPATRAEETPRDPKG